MPLLLFPSIEAKPDNMPGVSFPPIYYLSPLLEHNKEVYSRSKAGGFMLLTLTKCFIILVVPSTYPALFLANLESQRQPTKSLTSKFRPQSSKE